MNYELLRCARNDGLGLMQKFPKEGLQKGRHREERSDAAIYRCKIGNELWIASLRSQSRVGTFAEIP